MNMVLMSENDLKKDIDTKLSKHFRYLQNKYFIKDIKVNNIQIPINKRKKPIVELVVIFEKPIDLLKLINLENYLSRVLNVKASVVTKKALELYLSKYSHNKTIKI